MSEELVGLCGQGLMDEGAEEEEEEEEYVPNKL